MDLFSPETIERVTRQTSIEAMLAAMETAPTLRSRIWRILFDRGPQTPDEVAEFLGETVLAVRPRFTDLTKENKISDTGERRSNASGRKAIVWRANSPSLWHGEREHHTAQEQIEILTERVAYLEGQLAQSGVSF